MPPLVLETPEALKDFVGREIGVTDWFTVTQDRIRQFAEATEDRQWIHLGRERAERESHYGTTIAHGFLTLSLVSHLMKQAFQIPDSMRLAVNYGLNRVRFPAPVRANSRIRARVALQSWEQFPDSIEAVFLATNRRRRRAKAVLRGGICRPLLHRVVFWPRVAAKGERLQTRAENPRSLFPPRLISSAAGRAPTASRAADEIRARAHTLS